MAPPSSTATPPPIPKHPPQANPPEDDKTVLLDYTSPRGPSLFDTYLVFQTFSFIGILSAVLLVIVLVYIGWKSESPVVIAALSTLVATLMLLPPIYSPPLRRAIQWSYMPVCRYAKSFRFIIPTRPFPSDHPYIFVGYPHGRVSYSNAAFYNGPQVWRRLVPHQDLFVGAAGGFFWLPVAKHICYFLGIIPVSKESLAGKLRQGNSVLLMGGGVQELCLGTYDDKDVIYLRKRLGFAKLAMEEKAGVVPVYSFGENLVFKHDPAWLLKLFKHVNKHFRIGVPCFRGVWNLPMPYRRDILTVVGEPLFAQEGETLEDFHGRFVVALKHLFDKYVKVSGYPDHKLVIV